MIRTIINTLAFASILYLALLAFATTGLFAFSQPMAAGYAIGFASVVIVGFSLARFARKGPRR